ncbi:MAG: Zn-ribbon domain-containing protein [Candidatus Methanoperedens sp.]|nr:Zn-ribbon domain-containing protein [Candidatus Methanoperedens sp.]
MPHKCTRCESIFKDGAAIILNGCPKCGWNKFLYVRDETPEPEQAAKPDASVSTGQISPEASKFIKEVDDLLLIQDDPKQHELIKEQKVETPKEIGNRVESIRILSPGQYELNLESLLERKEIVMALKEDGTYIVHLPSVFKQKKDH